MQSERLPYHFLIRQVLKIYRSRLLDVFVIDFRQIQYFYVIELVEKDDAVHSFLTVPAA